MTTRARGGYWHEVWRQMRSTRRAMWGLWIVASLAFVAVFADLIANEKPYYLELDGENYFPIATDYAVWLGFETWPKARVNADYRRLAERAERAERAVWPPIPYTATRVDITGETYAPPSREHWLGTDQLGRDVAAGMVHGVRVSLTIGLIVVAIQATLGILLGALAGFYAGWIDLVLSRFFELMLGIPTFFLIITVAALAVMSSTSTVGGNDCCCACSSLALRAAAMRCSSCFWLSACAARAPFASLRACAAC